MMQPFDKQFKKSWVYVKKIGGTWDQNLQTQ